MECTECMGLACIDQECTDQVLCTGLESWSRTIMVEEGSQLLAPYLQDSAVWACASDSLSAVIITVIITIIADSYSLYIRKPLIYFGSPIFHVFLLSLVLLLKRYTKIF